MGALKMAKNFLEAKKIFEPCNTEELLRGWLLHSHKGRQRHDRAARRLDKIRIFLGALATALTVIVSASIFNILEQNSTGGLKFGLILVSILAAILSGLSTFLNLAERADKHRSAGVQYKAIIRELERKLSEGTNNSTITPSVLDEMQKRFDELEESAPIVPEWFFLLVEEEWNLHGIEPVKKADDLYKPNNQSFRGENLMQPNGDENFERLRFEHELINRRLTWLLSSQSILFAAYGIALGSANQEIASFFLKVTAISGIVIAGLILLGIVAGMIAKRTVWKDSKKKQFGVRTWITYLALVPDTLLPVVFIIAWLSILLN
jgi:hypothetical protein